MNRRTHAKTRKDDQHPALLEMEKRKDLDQGRKDEQNAGDYTHVKMATLMTRLPLLRGNRLLVLAIDSSVSMPVGSRVSGSRKIDLSSEAAPVCQSAEAVPFWLPFWFFITGGAYPLSRRRHLSLTIFRNHHWGASSVIQRRAGGRINGMPRYRSVTARAGQ